MKQQRIGYVYIMYSKSGHYKIGKSIDPFDRTRTIGTLMPFPVHLVYAAKMDDMNGTERFLHSIFRHSRVHGEWFNFTRENLQWIISGEWLDDLDLRQSCFDEVRP
jgi:hypothetical protein